MKSTFRSLLGATVLVLSTTTALAGDTFPSKPIRIVVNSAPGALLDVTTRTVAQKMAENLGQSVIVENNAGASGQLGIRYVKSAPADGYTLLATANTIAQLPALKLNPGYDLVKDFTGIGMMNRAPLLMVGPVGQSDKTLAEFMARAKAHPDSIMYASGGLGTSTHMAAAMFLHQAGLKMVHVPYKGNSAAMTDLVAGRVSMLFDGINSSGPAVKDGKLRAFGITSPTRMEALPDIPTLAEQGLPNYSFHVYMGLVVPSGTPREAVQRLSAALRYALSTDAVRDRFRRDGAEPGNTTPEQFTEFLRRDMQRTVKVVSDLGIPKE
jgi:tripartite-type tricarboxylate transporter receptor subunit TctC